MNHPKTRFAAVISSTILSLVLAATTCGTFAWFTYASNVYVHEYKGVSVGSFSLEIGYVSSFEFADAHLYSISEVEKTEDDKFIYWFRNSVSDEALHKLIELNGFSSTLLYPVTTGSYSKDDERVFSLLRAPVANENYSLDVPAEKTDFSHMSFVFRVCDQLKPGQYLSGNNIYLNTADIDSDYDIKESFRIYTNNREDESGMRHLINLDKNIVEDGYDEVGGVLDLDGDGFYDYTTDDLGHEVETYYGEYKNSVEDQSKVFYTNSPRDGDSNLIGEANSFNAKHRNGVYEIDSELTKPKLAYYESATNFLNETIPVTVTREYKVKKIIDGEYTITNENLAFLDCTIFVEGWDLKCVDPEIYGTDRPFESFLQFEVIL